MPSYKKTIYKKIRTRQKKAKSIGKEGSVCNHKAYQYYLKNKKKGSRKTVFDFVDHGKIINTFYEVISEKMLENPDGVFIKELGYFGMLLINTNNQMQSLFYDEEEGKMYRDYVIQSHSDGLFFSPHFVPIERSQILRTWNMDCSFSPTFKKKLSQKLHEGVKYKFNAPLFYQYTGQRKSKK